MVLGATGQIGIAAVERLALGGWQVRAVSRGGGPRVMWPAGSEVRTVHLDREDDRALAGVVREGCDVLVDCVAFTSRHGAQLAALGDRVGSAVVISTCMVYRDDDGLGFDALPTACPRLPVPVTEDQATIAPDDSTYAGGKAALERVLLETASFPVTLLRAGMVHGRGSAAPREWYFVKRALDRRPVRLLAHRGAGVCHPTATRNLAELVLAAAERPADRVLNAADPRPPTVRAMAAAVDELLGHEAEEYLLDGPGEPGLGRTPWSLEHPVVLDTARAERELGYRPACDWAGSLPGTVAWLVEAARGRDWREAFPRLAARWGRTAFDYAAEDLAVAAGQVGGRPLVPAQRR